MLLGGVSTVSGREDSTVLGDGRSGLNGGDAGA
jgi:hypothetical protein